MTVLPMNADRSRRTGLPLLWDRQLRPLLGAITSRPDAPPRALLVGAAGSGKSATLRRLHAQLAEREHTVHIAAHDAEAIRTTPAGDVLLVDDLHLLDDDALAALHARSTDPDACLIAAIRPWPGSEVTRRIARLLERSFPAVILGHVGRADVLDHLETVDRELPEHCVRHILEISGGASWLVSEALDHHDDRDCADDGEHSALRRALEARVSYRLDAVAPSLRRAVEAICLDAASPTGLLSDSLSDEVVLEAHAEGLLQRNGAPAPVVRSVVRSTITSRRLAELSSTLIDGLTRASVDEPFSPDLLGSLHDAAIGEAMVQRGERLMGTRPDRAVELFRGAEECGVDAARLTAPLAEAYWACGDLDSAMAVIDASHGLDDDRRIADIAAGVWASRGMMTQADSTYRALLSSGAATSPFAMIAGVGIGAFDMTAPSGPEIPAPSTMRVSMDLLRRGLSASTTSESDSALADLVRAAEMYTGARAHGPVPELPAVIAAVVALNLGALSTAQSVLDDAIHGQHGGLWARQRLLLWRAWVAVQRARPIEARAALDRAREIAPTMSPRDAFLAHAVRIAIARRYEDASGLESAWLHARAALLRADVDLYLLHPLTELISAAARMGDAARVRRHFARGLEITAALHDPPLWITHLRWAGIQQGILLGDPELVSPHAKALVTASADDHVAAMMAKAGRVWTSVLAGRVDAAAVEAAAGGLASVGMRWDGARLAGHGAARTDDRKIAARLLACARDLHPTDATRKPSAEEQDAVSDGANKVTGERLSARELEVARLVLQGKTYAEIGAAIFISPRTAEHHIAHIRHRLGAISRSDVIAKLRQLLLEDQSEDARNAMPDVAPPPPSLRVSG